MIQEELDRKIAMALGDLCLCSQRKLNSVGNILFLVRFVY